jgi:predicted transcriptional regulator
MFVWPMPRREKKLRQPHREYYEIVKQILQIVYTKADGYSKSFELAFRCQLTWDQFTRYRDLLFKQKLLISSNTGPSQHYEITDKGLRYLHIFAEIEENL